jgi:cyclohexanecarboxylate-CoA ligase
MEFDAVLLPKRRAQMIAQGFWHDRTINDDLDACLSPRSGRFTSIHIP